MGSPTRRTGTAAACARLGVDFVGADIDEIYLEEAVERVRGVGQGLPARGTARMKKAALKPQKTALAR